MLNVSCPLAIGSLGTDSDTPKSANTYTLSIIKILSNFILLIVRKIIKNKNTGNFI